MAALAAALLLAGCAADDQVIVGPDDPDASVVFPAAVTYAFESGAQLNYRLEMSGTNRVRSESDGNLSEIPDTELGLPAEDLELETSGLIDVTYWIESGPDDKTREIHLTADITELSITGIEDSDEAMLGSLFTDLGELLSVTVVVDEQGKVLEYAFPEIELSDGSVEQALFDLIQEQIVSTSAIGANFDGPLGPVFPADRLLNIGSSWTDRTENRIGDQTIVVDHTHEITDFTELNGVEVIVIESTATIGDYEIDMEGLFESAMESVMADLDDPTGDQAFDEAELEDAAAVIASSLAGMSQTWAPFTVESTTWMSYEQVADSLVSGIAQQGVVRMSGALTTEIDLSGHYDSAPDLVVRTSDELDFEIRFTLVGDDRG